METFIHTWGCAPTVRRYTISRNQILLVHFSMRTFDGDEVGTTLIGDGLREQGLPATGGPIQKHAGRNSQA